MAFFDRFRTKSSPSAPKSKEDVLPSKELEAVKKQMAAQAAQAEEGAGESLKAKGKSDGAYHWLRRPHVSEKAARLTDLRTYVFDVPVAAEKVAVRKAVESLYNVKVLRVNTIRHAGKPVYRGRRPGARNAWKKALVTLAKGQKIDLYEGV